MSVKVSTSQKSQRPVVSKAAVAPDASLASPSGSGQTSAETLSRQLHRLALDVHDGPMQNLTAIGFSLTDLRARMQAVVPSEEIAPLDANLEQISDELGKVESELRLLITALEDGVSKSIPLRDAIQSEIAEFERRTKIRVMFVFDDDVRAETDSQRIALQSVTRAALANVAKHSGATRVVVRLNGAGDWTRLEVEDNGRGFQADAAAKRGRMGLIGMQRRVELLGGEFRVTSRRGGPTTISAMLRAWRPDGD
jgi:signal transduction histidine kinase